ncbi:MAG TPA: DNA-3-methyladenine glycosylase I [Chloroflexota bacterium]|nr:DNA-3-methyladenine glycosylase I [Chloroflexota bacterium]
MNWKVVEDKWPGFLEAFHRFDPRYVANLSPKQVEAIAENRAVIRNRSKIKATVENANVMLELVKENRTFHDFLASSQLIGC